MQNKFGHNSISKKAQCRAIRRVHWHWRGAVSGIVTDLDCGIM